MAQVNAKLILRNDTAGNWEIANPLLALGELGLENDTGLIKMGDGKTRYNDLDYINNRSATEGDGALITYTATNKLTVANYGKVYYEYDLGTGTDKKIEVTEPSQWPEKVELDVTNGIARWVKPAATYNKTQGTITGLRNITLTNYYPEASDQVTTVEYVVNSIADAIANIDKLQRRVVTILPADSAALENVIYMIKDTTAAGDDKYKEYLVIDGTLTQIGDTSPDLANYVKLPDEDSYTEGNLVTVSNGALIDTGIAANEIIKIATSTTLGGIYSSTLDDYVRVTDLGFMALNNVTTDKLVNGDQEFVISGGNAAVTGYRG